MGLWVVERTNLNSPSNREPSRVLGSSNEQKSFGDLLSCPSGRKKKEKNMSIENKKKIKLKPFERENL